MTKPSWQFAPRSRAYVAYWLLNVITLIALLAFALRGLLAQ